MIGLRTRVVVVDAVEDAAEELFEAVVVVEATHHTRLEVAVVVLVGVVELELEGPTSMKALVVLLTQHFGLVVRVTGAFMQPGDMTAMAENKAIKTIPTMITLNSGIDNGMEVMVMAIRNMMTVNSGVSKWMRRMAMVITEMNRRLPATAAPRNEYVAEEAQFASHEVTRVSSMSCVPHDRGFCL